MEILEWLINSYYDNRHMKGLYNIHALLHGNTVTSGKKNSFSLKASSRLAVMRRRPVFAKETGNNKNQVVTILLIH